MQLKRLEAYGFKSFADKSEIEFDQGITAIVGPNGSGKSNITEAIRWVLGEQNIRNLRGVKAEDIIFTGSVARRSLGVAEVSLVFENDGELPVDFQEVVITRRLFRSGESEFYINKTRCRLKDIYDLLADTGLGHDGMSVISQNQMDEILNSKPEERRLFFEETAGITKYRSRKRESMRKLEDTEKNLVRVTDIIQEIATQLEPLAAQAEKTRQYNELQDAYKKCKLTDLCHQYDKLSRQTEENSKKIADSKDQEVAAEAAVQVAEARKQTLGKEILDLERSLQSLAEKNSALRDAMEAGQGEIRTLEERCQQGDANQARLQSQGAALQQQLTTSAAVKQDLQTAEAARQQEVQAAAEKLQKAKEQAGVIARQVKTQKDLCQQLNQKREQLQKDILAKQNELALLQHDIDTSNDTRMQREQAAAAAAAEIQTMQAEKTAADQEAGQKAEEHRHFAEQQKQGERQQQELGGKLQQLRQKIGAAQQYVQQADAKLQVLSHMQQAYEGFGRAAKSVLTARESWNQGVCGAVAELLTVPPDYITAAEVALGGNQQNVVTKDTETAKQAIAYLKRTRAGRVTFLPLSTLVVRPSADAAIRHEPGVIGYMNEVVGASAEYRKVVDFLLARTVLTDTLDHALALAKKQGYRLRIVTVGGELLNPGGSLSGGSQQHREASFLNRRGEIETLQQALTEKKQEAAALQAQQETMARTMEASGQAVAAAKKELQAVCVREAELRIIREKLAAQLDGATAKLTAMKELAAHQETTFAQAQKQRVQALHDLQGLQSSAGAVQAECAQTAEKLEDSEQDAQDLAKYVNSWELKRTVFEQEVLRSQERLLLKQREIEQTSAALAAAQQEQAALLAALTEGNERLQKLRQDNVALQQRYQAATDEQQKIYQAKMEKLVESQQHDQKARDAAQRLNALQAKLHQLQLDASKVQFELAQCVALLQDEYALRPEQAASYCLPLTAAALRQRREELSAKIASLGAVNPQAIEEYEELRKRHDFMQQQAADLSGAKENLQRILKEMDVTMTRQFREAFAKIREYFNAIFVELFGGGQADLLLTDEHDVLNAGVEIEVQLPDKKRQNLSALSGGERALTVIALLFAFLRCKPAPFSVLDEIDAPLDEANIARFGKFLRQFAENTQFIIVTHRKGTMEAADTLYGITLEAAGVSKIISVKLDEVSEE